MKHAAKRTFFLILFLLSAVAVYASGKTEQVAAPSCSEGLSSGAVTALTLREGTIKYTQVIKTTYFDIIYPAQSERTARILASRIDALYEKAAAEFETDPWMKHFPVIISPSTQVFNAYYTSSPYNHIVLLDTPNTSATLAVESETIVNTFYHELIHAVTANIHKKSRDNRRNLLGDFYSLQFLLNSKLFTIEGATVSRESSEGEGRINSGEAMSPIIQSKLEGVFPSWEDIAGPRDIYPAQTASYIFGGAFNWWLQETYGMSLYADFWKECSEVDLLGFSHIFKKVYGMSLDDAWALFEETVPVPAVENDALRTILDDDARFATLAIRPGFESGIVYTKNQCSVCYYALNGVGPDRTRELFSCYGSPEQLSFSGDGRYLAVSGYMTGSTEAYSVRIYDMETGLFTGAEIPYSRNAVITSGTDGKQYLYCIESAASYEFATLYLFDDVLNAAETVPSPVSRYEMSVFDELYDTTPVSGGAACLRKTDGVWYITVALTDGTAESWRLPDDVVPTGLSSGLSLSASRKAAAEEPVTLYTSITSKSMNSGSESEPGALARLGVITIKDGCAELSYQKTAFSGGVHSPVVSRGGDVYSIANLYESSTLSYYRLTASELTAPVCLESAEPDGAASEEQAVSFSFQSEKYKPLSYMTRGVLFPIAGLSLGPFSVGTLSNSFGATWWTETPDDKVNLELSFGIPYPEMMMNMEIYASLFGQNSQLSGGTFLWDLDGTIQFDLNNRVNMLIGRIMLAEQIPLSNPGEQITIANGAAFVDASFNPLQEVRYQIEDSLTFQYVRQKKYGMNAQSMGGFAVGAHLLYMYSVSNNYTLDVKSGLQKYNESTYASPGISALLKLPRLLTVVPYYPKLTVNLPASFSASLWSDPGTFVSADASVTLFSAEIQKGIPLVPFYCNRFVIDAGWSFRNGAPEGFSYTSSWLCFQTAEFIENFNTLNTVNALTAGVNFVLSPDIANMYSAQFNLGINGKYYIRNDNTDSRYDITVLGIFRF